MVSADPALLHRMLANLLDNAIKHLPPGTTIYIRLQVQAGFGRLEIEDDGPGFPPEVVNRPFEKYVKGKTRAEAASAWLSRRRWFAPMAVIFKAFNGPRGGACIVIDLRSGARFRRGTIPFPAKTPDCQELGASPLLAADRPLLG